MNIERSLEEEVTHSFVVRLWQEAPGRWRGTVRHVQSQAQQGINGVSQASDFMAAQCRAVAPRPARRAVAPAPRPAFDLGGWGGRRLQLGGLLAGLLVVSLVALLVARTPAGGAPGGFVLAGAAVALRQAQGAALPLALTFVAGALAGGLAVAWWARWRRRG